MKPSSFRVQLILFTFIRTLLNTAVRMMYPFLAVFARGLGVTVDQVSLALTVRQFMGMFNPFLSPLADRFGRRVGMLTGLGIFVVGAGILVLFPRYEALFPGLSLSLLGMFLVISSMQAYIGDQVSYEQRGRTMAVVEFGWSLSFILGITAVGFLIARYGWQSPFPVLAGLGLIALIALARVVPQDRPQRGTVHNPLANLGVVLRSPAALAGLGMGLCFTAANEVVNLMFGVWMEDTFGLQIAALSAASVVIGLSELSGEGITALIVDRLGKARAIRIGLAANSLFALALPWLSGSLWGALAGLFFFYLSFEFTLVSSLPLMSEILPSARATLLGLNIAIFSLGRAIGTLIAPQLYDFGFWSNGAAALLFNLAAFLLLGLVHVAKQPTPSDPA